MTSSNDWEMIGFAGQFIFTSRFAVQWAASERQKSSVIPVAFWWLSLAGGVTLFTYAVLRNDRPIIVGQGMGLFVYVRNLMLVRKSERRAAKGRKVADDAQEAVTSSPHLRADARHDAPRR